MNDESASRGLHTAAVILLSVGVLFLVLHDLAILGFPYDLIYGEGFVLRDAAMLRAGANPYTPLAGLPSVVANYPPVYPAIVALASVPFGLGFFAGRLVSVLATAGAAWLLLRIARRALGAGRPAYFAPLIFLADVVVYYWSPYARVDMLALFLDLAALDAFHRVMLAADGEGSPRARRALGLGLLCALLAAFTRPTALAAPAAFLAALALARRARLLGGSLVALALGAGSAVALLGVATGGEFLLHTVTYNANAFRWSEMHNLLLDFVTPHAPLFLGAGAFYLLGPRARPQRLLGLYFVFGCASALLVGKVGSSANYFLPAVASGALLFGIALGRSEGAARRVLLLAAASIPLLVTTVPWVRPLELRLNPFPAMGRTPGADDRAAGDEIDRLVRETPGEVLIEDAGFLVRAGKRCWAAPLVLAYLEEQGRYDPAPLAEMIRRREFDAIILSYNFFSPALRAAIGEAYRPENVIELPRRYKYVVLKPAR